MDLLAALVGTDQYLIASLLTEICAHVSSYTMCKALCSYRNVEAVCVSIQSVELCSLKLLCEKSAIVSPAAAVPLALPHWDRNVPVAKTLGSNQNLSSRMRGENLLPIFLYEKDSFPLKWVYSEKMRKNSLNFLLNLDETLWLVVACQKPHFRSQNTYEKH